MRDERDEFENRLRGWNVEPPREDLAQRVVMAATARPQRAWPWRLSVWLEDAFTQWRHGWTLKAGALVLCAVVGFLAGQLQNTVPDRETDIVVSMALAETLWGDGTQWEVE